jgi:hypothetical protein
MQAATGARRDRELGVGQGVEAPVVGGRAGASAARS